MSEKLDNNYVAGFVDGEGCFALKYRTDKQVNKETGKVREYKYWSAEFAIVLHPSDKSLLYLIKEKFGVGSISFKKTGDQARFSVQKTKNLKEVIIPFFKKYRLKGVKSKDFELWSKAVLIIAKHKEKTVRGKSNPVNEKDVKKLLNLKNKINLLKRRGKAVRF